MTLPTIPIWQAPTGSVATPELCAAVSNAGGMGSLGLSWTDPETAKSKIRQVKELTENPFFVNFALAFQPQALQAALDEGAPIVTFSWGDPTPHIRQVREAKASLGIQVTTNDEAKRALDLNPDFLICQGIEAGGHVESQTPLRSVLSGVLEEAKRTPVIAAGGITTAGQIAEILSMGARAVILGTRFVATQESGAHPEYKQELLKATGETTLTNCFDGGWPNAPHRVLRNSTLQNWEQAGAPTARRPGEGDILGHTVDGEPIYRYDDAAPQDSYSGSIEEMCLYSGMGVGEILDIPSAGDLVRRLWAEVSAGR